MLTKEQSERILHSRNKPSEEPLQKTAEPSALAEITYALEGILFSTQELWTVWVNHAAYTPAHNRLEKDLFIVALDHTSAEIRHANGTRHIIFPGQHYQSLSGNVSLAQSEKEEEKTEN